MSADTSEAYRKLLICALYHLRLDLACCLNGLNWLPWVLFRQAKQIKRASLRAYSFHNLVLFTLNDFNGFSEDKFWQEIGHFDSEYPGEELRYRKIFESALSRQKIDPH